MGNLIPREFQLLSKINYTLLLILGVGFSVFSQCEINPIDLDLGPDMALCEGDAVEFYSNIHDNLDEYTFEWSSSKNEVFNTKSLLVTDSGYYFFTAENAYGCIESDTVYVFKEEIPYLEVQSQYKICEGDTLNFLDSLNTEGYDVHWIDGSVESDNNIVNPGNYEFIISNVNCMYIQEFQVEFHTLIPLEDLYVCEELQENILLDSINSNILHFENLTSGEVYREYISFPGEYRAMSDAGCVLETINLINKCPFNLYIPNTITPNNDGINDDFEIFSTGLKDIEIIVFNRWGKKVDIQKKSIFIMGI